MQYSVSNIRYETMEEDDAFVYFYFTITFIKPEPLVTETFIPYRNLSDYIKSNYAAFYNYIKEVRESLDTWGPDELETIEALSNEGIALLYSYLEEYLLTCNWMEDFYNKELERSKHSITRQIDDVERAADALEDLQDSAESAFNEQKKYRQFCKLVQKEARRIAVEVYPELLDANKEQMKVFKYIFVDGIIKMHDDLSDHLANIE